jgi:hypothetical protein
VLENLQRLVGTFSHDIEVAKRVESPNPEDDLTSRAAIVGFSYHCSSDDGLRGTLILSGQESTAITGRRSG